MRVTASAPCRISLAGGGSDVGEYRRKYGGVCINLAINFRQKVTLGEENKILENDNPDFFKAFTDLPVKHEFDLETESGLGSSAALAVALTGAVNYLSGVSLNPKSIADKAGDTEVNKLGLFGGMQDQYASAFGGANLLLFQERNYRYSLPKNKIEKIVPHLVLFNTGIKRTSPNIQEGLRNITTSQKIVLDRIKEIAWNTIDAIWDGDINYLGTLMDEAWECKRQSNKGISGYDINAIYHKAKRLGAIGGKLLGSGGGGCMLFVTENPQKLVEGMGIEHIPFEVDWEGFRIEKI